jgi:hypothetical protein
VNDRDKHGGLQRYRINYGRKNVYSIPAAKETDFKMKRNVKVKEDKDKKIDITGTKSKSRPVSTVYRTGDGQ